VQTIFGRVPQILCSGGAGVYTCFPGMILPRCENGEDTAGGDDLRASNESVRRSPVDRELQPCDGISLRQNASPTPKPKVWPSLPWAMSARRLTWYFLLNSYRSPPPPAGRKRLLCRTCNG
jgi:hypothetical protein